MENPLTETHLALTVGSIVHYVLESGEHRPAIVVRDWSNAAIPGSNGMVNLLVFTDGSNDNFKESLSAMQGNGEAIGLMRTANVIWRTSVHHSTAKEPGTWHAVEQRRIPMETTIKERIENNFTYHAPKTGQVERYTRLREKAKELALLACEVTPYSREQSLGMTALEEAVMWFNAAIARNE